MARSRYEGTRMFHLVTRTWNPVTGCRHDCVYCWARKLVETRLSKVTKKYREGFKPKLHEEELRVEFKPSEFVFVCDMGDLFGGWVPREWILKVLDVVRRFPKTTFLFLTKNPDRYLDFEDILRELDNVVLGATIETDNDWMYWYYNISRAPQPSGRLLAMRRLRRRGFTNIMISIEPILYFTDFFAYSIIDIEPAFVYVGYDNYGNKLPEPPLYRTLRLIGILRSHGITVYTKTLRKAWWEEGG